MPLLHAPITDDEWSSLLGPAADALAEGLIVQDAACVVRASNRAAQRMSGLGVGPDSELNGSDPHDPRWRPYHPDGRLMTLDEQPAIMALRTGVPQRDVRVLLRGGGRELWLSVNSTPLVATAEDQPYGVVTSFVDVTAYVEAQQALEARESELGLLATHAGDLIARHEADGRIKYAAGGAEALLGIPAEQMVGFWAADICHPDDAEAIRESHERAREGRANTVSFRVRHLVDGRELWLESTVQPILDADGQFIEAVTTTRDVTERKRAELQMRRQHAQLEEVQAMADLGSWAKDLRTGEVWWSEGLFRIFGLDTSVRERAHEAHDALVHPEDAGRLRRVLARAARDGLPFEHSYRLTRPDGAERIFHGRGAPAERDADGRIVRVWGTTQDVTDLHRLEESRRAAEHRFLAAFEHAPIGMCVLELQGSRRGRWVTANPAMSELLGWADVPPADRSLTGVVHPEDLEASLSEIELLGAGVKERVSVERRLLHADGHVIWALVTVAAITGERGERPQYAIAQIVDITERKRFEGQLQHLADHDPLTGLFNRRRFEEELDRALAAAERYGRAGAVIVLDLDGFKFVNDTLGHPVGDRLIGRLAGTLRAELRETDVVARLGGDEFGIILPEADEDQARAVTHKLLRAVERDGVVADANRHARVTASAGVAAFDGADGLSAEELLVEADIAMYDAKEAGRNQASVHERVAGGSGRHVSRLSWLERIRTALAEDRFELHAQPIVSLTGDEPDPVPAFELLLRMRSDGDELIPPATFLGVAERFDLIQHIDRWVVERAVGLLRREHAAGRPVTLSVNLSGRTIGDAAFGGWLEELLTRTPVPAGHLVVEITETAAIVSLDRARALGDTLRRLGCRLALDDFGAGFASFAYLKHLHFDVLKIDGEFVRGLRDNPTDRLVVEAVVAIARGLGTPSLAEFVTDSDTLAEVRALGVDFAQGFHLGRPIPVEEALAGAARHA